MADQENKADDREDQDDGEGHMNIAAKPDDDDAEGHVAIAAKPDDDDTEGHNLPR